VTTYERQYQMNDYSSAQVLVQNDIITTDTLAQKTIHEVTNNITRFKIISPKQRVKNHTQTGNITIL